LGLVEQVEIGFEHLHGDIPQCGDGEESRHLFACLSPPGVLPFDQSTATPVSMINKARRPSPSDRSRRTC
jgi:hypothetical protein